MIQDCPFLKDGIDYLTNEIGYNAIVRNSGGLGVVLDQVYKYIADVQRTNRNND